MLKRLLIIISLLLLVLGCSKNKEPVYVAAEIEDPNKLYSEALQAIEKRDFFYAQKKFFEAERYYKNVDFAAKAALMGGFSLYGINFYSESLDNLERYLKTYPADKNIQYAHYLIAIIYFEQISDEKKNIQPLYKAKEKIDFFINKYSGSEYAVDLMFKRDLIENQLAAKELFVAKYYISLQKWIPAINRLKIIVKKYDKTIFIEEALHRLVEIHYHIGLEEEAKNFAKILGYNYNSSEWYEQSYKILNKSYVIPNKISKNKDSLFKKILKKIYD
tara:strand:- start:424 stop:1248 length:825 start_codon:yes stop_codon:yes gene_type:complete